MSPIPELDPIREDATLNATEYIAALQAMAAEARNAAAAQGQLVAALKATQELMDSMAAGAAEAAAAENHLADAESSAARAAEEAAMGAANAASADRDLAEGASAAALAEDAAAEAAGNLAKANAAAGAGAFDAAEFEKALAEASLASAAAGRAAANAADASRDAYAALALGEAAAAEEAEKLAEAQAAGSLAAYQDAQAAKTFAEADAAAAMAASELSDVVARQTAIMFANRAAMAAAGEDATAAANSMGNAANRAAGPWFLFGNTWRTALHWIVAGSAEFLAVAAPAAIALGAGLAVAAQGAQNVYQHFSALYDSTESTANAMHTTVGDVLHLGNALQTAQNQANPGVYELLGSAVNDAKAGFSSLASVGLQVVHMFDEFSARVTVDLQQGLGTEVQGLLSGMVTDLQRFGDVLGNLGHAVLNFAAAMPGLAHVLLDVAVGLSEVVEWASRGGVLLTFAMAMEETFRWGGLLLGVLARLAGAGALMSTFQDGGGFIAHFGAAIKALLVVGAQGIEWAGQMIGQMTRLGTAANDAGAGIEVFGADAAAAASELSTGMIAGVTLAIAALTFLAVKLATMRTATEQWVDASNEAVAKASDLNVLPAIYTQLANTITRATGAQQQYSNDAQHLTQNVTQAGRAGDIMSQSMMSAGQNATALSGHMLSLIGTADTVISNVHLLAGVFHTSAIGALALANAAGVNLQLPLTASGEAAKIAEQQITNLKTGLGAMAAPATEIGADMEAVGVASQLASSKVQTVNQSMDALIGATTGGMNTIMQFNAALHGMGNDAAATNQSVTGAIDSISRSAANMGYTLQGIGPKAQQSWQQFDAAVQQGNSVLDTMRTGMAEGVVSQQQYTNEIKATGGALLPFAAHNKTALAIVSQLAQEMGDPATSNLRTLAAQFGITGKAAEEMGTKGMEQAVAKMANLNVVARNLSVTVGTQLDTAMASAITKFSGVQGAANKYAQALASANTPQSVLAKDQAAFNAAMDNEGRMVATATGDINRHAGALGGLGAAYKGATSAGGDFANSTKQASDSLTNVEGSAKAASLSAQGLGEQAHAAATSASGLSSNASQANGAVRNLGASASATRGSLGDVNNEIRTASSAAGAAQGPLMGMANNINSVGSSASSAAGQVHDLAGAIASLQSKSITVTTNLVTNTEHRAAGGPVAAGVPYTVGEYGREMFVPAQSGFIVPAAQTHALVAAANAGGGQPSQGGQPQVIHLTATINHTTTLDGEEVAAGTQVHAAQWEIRNGRAWPGTERSQ